MKNKEPIKSDSELKEKRENQKDGLAHWIIIIFMLVVGATYLLAFIVWMINIITPWIFLTKAQLNIISSLFIGSTFGGVLMNKITEIFRDHT